MKSSLLCLALLLVTSCGTTVEIRQPTITSETEMDITANPSENSTDYNDNDDVKQTTKSINVITRELTTTATTEAYVPATCPPCSTCLLALTVEDHTMLVIGGLTLGCLLLFMITMVLACKVCCLQRERGDYQPCHTDSHLTNGKKKTEVSETNETGVMMTEVFNEDETATEERERKEEDNMTTGSEKSSEGKGGAGESISDTIMAAASDDQKQSESNAEEASKSPAASETTDMADGTRGGAEEPADSRT